MRRFMILPFIWLGMASCHAQTPSPSYGSGTMADTPAISQAWPDIMSAYLTGPEADGLVRIDYARLKSNAKDSAALDSYIAKLTAQNPDAMSAAEATAYWANLYNALTVDVVLDNYPVKSIREIKSGAFSPGPWKRDLVVVNGENVSLDKIEHGILRVKYASPLIHYMVNCASVGCPNLIDGEWSAATLDTDRDQAARDFINSPRGVRMTPKGLVVSSIFKWFDKDFGGSKESVLQHIRQYADTDLAAAIDNGARIKGYDYDWSLNAPVVTSHE